MNDAVPATNLARARDDAAPPMPPAAAVTSARAVTLLLALTIAVGVGLRLKHYFARTAYWHDEASLVLNVFEKTALQLVGGPLDSAQAAAPGFLAIERGVHVLLGRSELAMRLPPMLAAVAGIALFAHLAWRTCGRQWPPVALLLIAIWACSERLIWHAAEAKQYSFDVLVSLLLLAVALTESRTAVWRTASCAAVATVAIWLSHPTAFVFGGVSLALLPYVWRERRRAGAAAWFACNVAFGLSFAALYVVSVRNQQVNALYEYWAAGFVPFAEPWVIPIWLLRQLAGIANYAFDLGGPVLLPLGVVGGYAMWRTSPRQRQMLAILLTPFGLVLVASAIRQYPFSGSRLTLFLTPNVFLLTGFGLAAMLDWARGRAERRWLTVAVPAYLLGVAAWHAVVYLVRPPVYGNMPAAVRYVAQHDAPGDVVYANKISEFKCYWPGARVRDAAELASHVPDGRFWLVLSYRAGKSDGVVRPLLAEVKPEATQLDAFSVPGGSAMLFDGIDGPATRATTD